MAQHWTDLSKPCCRGERQKVYRPRRWLSNPSEWKTTLANTNIGRLFTIVTKVAKPQEVNFHVPVSIFFSGVTDTFYTMHKHEETMEVLPKPHHTALTLLFLIAYKTVYDVDDQINLTRAVVLHADMVWYWVHITAFEKVLQKKVLKSLLLFYITRNDVMQLPLRWTVTKA